MVRPAFSLRSLIGPRLLAAGLVAMMLTVVANGGVLAGGETSIDTTGAFFSFHLRSYNSPDNLELMREGKVLMAPHGITDISEFTWARPPGTSLSWMMDIEELLYLLPFIGSGREVDREFAVDWYQRWRQAHAGSASPNAAAWDGMTTGMRAAVLSYFLHTERGRNDGGISAQLLESLGDHRVELAEGAYNFNSNHGVWQAIGLIETGRALGDNASLELGLLRLEDLVTRQVSPMGFHLEHAPHYHFAFLKWLDEMVAYLETLAEVDQARVASLAVVRGRMKDAGYYLQDHRGDMLPIGDTFRLPVFSAAEVDTSAVYPLVRFDPGAGYACYKERPGPGSGRQVVFNIQSGKRDFPYHFHDDALALVVSYKGESLLGDLGGYDYGYSAYRKFFRSRDAHNLVAPHGEMFAQLGNVVDPHYRDAHDGGVVFDARRPFGPHGVERSVVIPGDSPVVVIEDRVVGPKMRMIWNVGIDVVSVEAGDSAATAPGGFDRRWKLVTGLGRVFEFRVTSDQGSSIGDAEFYNGSTSPMFGWYSLAYQTVVESPTLVINMTAWMPVEIRTTLSLVGDIE